MTRDQELWAMALHVERHQGANGPRYIVEQIERNARLGELGGVDLWEEVARRFYQFSTHGVGVSVGAQ